MDRKELITTIENRLQLALIMSIFFPTLSSVFYGSAGVEGATLNKNVLQLMGLVGLYLVGYVFFQIEKRMRVSERLLRILNTSLLIGIAFFIIPVFFLTTTDAKTPVSLLSWWTIASLYASVWGLPLTALISFLLISAGIGEGATHPDSKLSKLADRVFKRR